MVIFLHSITRITTKHFKEKLILFQHLLKGVTTISLEGFVVFFQWETKKTPKNSHLNLEKISGRSICFFVV